MKVGDYVRTSDGYISKYIGKNKTPYCAGKHLSFETTIRDTRFEEYDENTMIWESEIEKGFVDIVKSSPNVIDIIEVGDYVNKKRVTGIDGIKKKIYVEEGYYFNKKDIVTILTKEQFKNMEYKL